MCCIHLWHVYHIYSIINEVIRYQHRPMQILDRIVVAAAAEAAVVVVAIQAIRIISKVKSFVREKCGNWSKIKQETQSSRYSCCSYSGSNTVILLDMLSVEFAIRCLYIDIHIYFFLFFSNTFIRTGFRVFLSSLFSFGTKEKKFRYFLSNF